MPKQQSPDGAGKKYLFIAPPGCYQCGIVNKLPKPGWGSCCELQTCCFTLDRRPGTDGKERMGLEWLKICLRNMWTAPCSHVTIVATKAMVTTKTHHMKKSRKDERLYTLPWLSRGSLLASLAAAPAALRFSGGTYPVCSYYYKIIDKYRGVRSILHRPEIRKVSKFAQVWNNM